MSEHCLEPGSKLPVVFAGFVVPSGGFWCFMWEEFEGFFGLIVINVMSE
jgi:hypothetical protein